MLVRRQVLEEFIAHAERKRDLHTAHTICHFSAGNTLHWPALVVAPTRAAALRTPFGAAWYHSLSFDVFEVLLVERSNDPLQSRWMWRSARALNSSHTSLDVHATTEMP